jgi:hypothetical protein
MKVAMRINGKLILPGVSIFFIHGCGILVHSSSVFSSPPYFSLRLRTSSLVKGPRPMA